MDRRDFIRASVGAVAMSTLDAASSRGSTAKSRATSNPVSALENVTLGELIENYVAVWNEPDPSERRRRIRSVWAEGGVTCYRLSHARGYEEIEGRVTSSWEKWLRDGKYIFRPNKTACHHDVVRFEFSMVALPDGRIQGRGLNFLILDGHGRIHSDLQFSQTVHEATGLVDRYLAVANERDEGVRRARVIELWAPDATYVGEQSVKYGHTDLVTSARVLHQTNANAEFVFAPGKTSQAHHNLVTFSWLINHQVSGKRVGAGSDLLVLDENGRIRIDYQFTERPED
jgi:hypothetical protein